MKLTNYFDDKEYTLEVESLPAYFKNIAHNIKVISEDKCLWITNNQDVLTHRIPIYFLVGEDYKPSTPEEFNAAFESAINHINELNK